jgi:hypothetical protein
MKQKIKKYTQHNFASLFTCLDQPGASRLLSGIDKVSFPLAVELSQIFPAKDILSWKNASKEDLNRLYEQLKREAA